MESKHHIRVPFPTPGPPKDGLYKFKFERPSAVKLVGAYGLKAAAKNSSGITIDVAVMIPDVFPRYSTETKLQSTFQEKDYLDYRYFYKRACYLCSLAVGIKSSNLPISMEFEHLHGDERKPVLILSSLHGYHSFTMVSDAE